MKFVIFSENIPNWIFHLLTIRAHKNLDKSHTGNFITRKIVFQKNIYMAKKFQKVLKSQGLNYNYTKMYFKIINLIYLKSRYKKMYNESVGK